LEYTRTMRAIYLKTKCSRIKAYTGDKRNDVRLFLIVDYIYIVNTDVINLCLYTCFILMKNLRFESNV